MLLLPSADIIKKKKKKKKLFKKSFLKNPFTDAKRVSNYVCPDLGPNYLQRLSADEKGRHLQGER